MALADRVRDGRRPAAVALAGAGLLVLAAALVVLVLGLLGVGDDDEPDRPPRTSATAVVQDARFGVRLRHPRSWRRDDERRAIRLTSADRLLGLSVTTVASRPAALRVRAAVERQVVRSFDGGRILRRFAGRVGGRPARLAAITGANARGERLDVLLATVASRWRTYAVVTFGSARASQRSLRQAESILASLQFFRPGR